MNRTNDSIAKRARGRAIFKIIKRIKRHTLAPLIIRITTFFFKQKQHIYSIIVRSTSTYSRFEADELGGKTKTVGRLKIYQHTAYF
jgi:hypothetical protein